MLILLDIDGVMVPANSWRRPEFLNDGFPAFSDGAVKALQKIISETRADILLTTSHKSKYTISQWREIFKLRNIDALNFDRLPENSNHLSRKEEIMNWVNTQLEIQDFMIIDDDKSLNGLPEFVKNRLIQTIGSVGLTEYLADYALERVERGIFYI